MGRKLVAVGPTAWALFLSIVLAAPVAQAAGIKVQNANFDYEGRQVIVKGKLDGFGDSAHVVVTDKGNGDELASATVGKQFGFKIPFSSIADVPCEIEIAVGTETASAEVNHCPGPGQFFEFVLTGIVTDEPVPFATVSVTLNGVTYTTTADEFGNYSLPILTDNLNQLVRIDASAENPETGDPIEFVNLAGTFSRIVDGNANGNVTNVTTASYVLALEANGGTEPTTAEELALAETAIDATELFELAALIKLIVDDPAYSLPEGETSLIDFVSDAAAVEAYVESVPQEDLDAALGEILADSNLVAGFSAADIPERYFAVPTTSPGFIARRGETLEFGVTGPEANTGSLLGLTPGVGVDEGFAWTIDVSGRLVLDFEDYGLTSFPFRDFIRASDAEKQILADAEIDWIQEDREIISYTYTRVTDGTLVDVALREIRTIITYPPITLPDGSELVIAGQPFVEIETDEQTLRSSLDIEPIPFVATCPGSNNNVCVEGNWGGQFHFSPGPDFFGNPYPATAWGDIAAFNADGTVASATGRNLSGSWTIDPDGALVIDYDDGWTQKMQVLDRLGIEYGIISDYSNGSERFASYTIYVKSDGTEFNAGLVENGAGKFWNGDLNSWQPEAFDENGVRNLDFRFGWQFDAGANTGRNRWGVDFLGCDKGLFTTDMTWDIQPDGRLLIDRFANFAAGVFIRTWHPVALTTSGGERVLYVMEVEDRLRVDGQPGFGIRIPPRLNIQREIDEFTDWGCSASR